MPRRSFVGPLTEDENLVDDSPEVVEDFDEDRHDDVEIVHDEVGRLDNPEL